MKAVYYSLGVLFATAAAATILQAGYLLIVRIKEEGDPEDAPLLNVTVREGQVPLHPEFIIRGVMTALVPAVLVLLLGLSTDLSSSQTCIDHIGKIAVPRQVFDEAVASQ